VVRHLARPIAFLYYAFMAKSITVVRKKRGRPATGQDPVSAIRMSEELTRRIDQWAVAHKVASRSEAIRHLVELGLASRPAPGRNSKATAQASELAAREIDRLSDTSVTVEEHAARKRRLIKGPGAFRDIRRDQPKSNK
jgi:Arc/MetJ-type ribon-helix-helix transcriptional regulator